jgi:hypothetical protein
MDSACVDSKTGALFSAELSGALPGLVYTRAIPCAMLRFSPQSTRFNAFRKAERYAFFEIALV